MASDTEVRLDQGSQVPCSAIGASPIYIALIHNFTVLMNTTNTASSKLYQEGNYTCVATNKYGTDVKHFVIKEGEKMTYFETNQMQRVAKEGEGDTNHASRLSRITGHFFPITLIYVNRSKCVAISFSRP